MPHQRKRRRRPEEQRQAHSAKRQKRLRQSSASLFAEENREPTDAGGQNCLATTDYWHTASGSPLYGRNTLQVPNDPYLSRPYWSAGSRAFQNSDSYGWTSIPPGQSGPEACAHEPLPEASSSIKPRYIRHNGTIPIKGYFWEMEGADLRLPRFCYCHKHPSNDPEPRHEGSSEDMLERRVKALEWVKELEKKLVKAVLETMLSSIRLTKSGGQALRIASQPPTQKPPATGSATTSSLYRALDTAA